MKRRVRFNKYYLVINLGLRSIRIILFDTDSNIIEKNWYPIQTTIKNDEVEQSPVEWWKLTEMLLKEILNKKENYKKNLRAITVTSSASCLVVTDRKGAPLLNSFMVSDKRAKHEAEQIKAEKSFFNIFQNPNYQPVASYMFPKILWIRKNLPQIFKKAQFFMSSNDFLIFKLTGKLISDSLNAEKFYFDNQLRSYPKEILDYIGVKTAQLPSVQDSGYVVGNITKELKKMFGLERDVKVVLSTYDALCAFLGSGISSEGEISNVCGTVSSVRALSNKHLPTKNGILSQQLQKLHIIGGSNNIDGGLLEWSKDMFYGDSYPDQYVYRIMEEEAAGSPVGSRGIIFSPYILGERLPFFDTTARGIFFGVERFHRRNDLVRSIFEASSFMVQDIINHIEESGIKTTSIKMSGGFTRNLTVCQIRADVTGKQVEVIDGVETTSRGALFIMLISLREYDSFKEVAKKVKIQEVFRPDEYNHEYYKKMFFLFKKIYHVNKNLMEERSSILSSLDTKEVHTLSNL